MPAFPEAPIKKVAYDSSSIFGMSTTQAAIVARRVGKRHQCLQEGRFSRLAWRVHHEVFALLNEQTDFVKVHSFQRRKAIMDTAFHRTGGVEKARHIARVIKKRHRVTPLKLKQEKRLRMSVLYQDLE
jgi:hypothetical protein